MYTFKPSAGYAYSTKLDDSGESVAALQVNLNVINSSIVVDGVYGLSTEQVVKQIQQEHNLVVDGIAGPNTQRAICLQLMGFGFNTYHTPVGLLRGICEHESGYILPAYAAHPSDPGFDLGPFQDSFPPRAISQENFAAAYNAKVKGLSTASSLRMQKDQFFTAFYSRTNQRAWQLAALYHNWPFAATNLAYHGNIYTNDPSIDTQFAQWVFDASGGRLSTPLEWVNDYISKVCKYVSNWTA